LKIKKKPSWAIKPWWLRLGRRFRILIFLPLWGKIRKLKVLNLALGCFRDYQPYRLKTIGEIITLLDVTEMHETFHKSLLNAEALFIIIFLLTHQFFSPISLRQSVYLILILPPPLHPRT